MSHHRWRSKPTHKSHFRHLSGPFFSFIIVTFFLFLGYNTLHSFLFWDKKSLFTTQLSAVASYISIYNRPTAELVQAIDHIVQWYINKDNIFDQHADSIEKIWNIITSTDDEILLRNNERLQWVFQFIEDLAPHREELLLYLWKNTPKSYLVLLQNSSEKRPNGWFFGSFAYVRISQGRIRAMHIIDSYLWYKTMPRVTINPPSRSAPIYNNEPYGWIAANKFGFTNIDGHHIIDLYDKTFNHPDSKTYLPPELCRDMCDRPIDGVIFVNTDTLKQLLPGLDKKTRERQFVNSAIDIIRGDNLPHKKEYYLTEVKDFFTKNQTTLVSNLVRQFDRLTSKYNIGIYIPSISFGLQNILTQYNFTTIPNNHTLYFWDTNKSFNKIDEFVHKEIIVRDQRGDIVAERINHDHLDIQWLPASNYSIEIQYKVHVPIQYQNTINLLAEQYNITLTEREQGILSLAPTYDEYGNPRLWSTRSQIYYPNTIEIHNISGNYDDIPLVSFTTPFGKGIEYGMHTTENNSTHTVRMTMTIK